MVSLHHHAVEHQTNASSQGESGRCETVSLSVNTTNVVQPGLYLVGFCIEHVDLEDETDNADATEESENSES